MSFLLPDGNHSRFARRVRPDSIRTRQGTWLADLFDVYMSDPDPVPIRVLDDLIRLLLGGSATKEGMGRDLNAILIIDTRWGPSRRNDTLKSTSDGADRYNEPWSVHSHSLQEIARTAAFREHVELQHPTARQCLRLPRTFGMRRRNASLPLERRSRFSTIRRFYCSDHLFFDLTRSAIPGHSPSRLMRPVVDLSSASFRERSLFRFSVVPDAPVRQHRTAYLVVVRTGGSVGSHGGVILFSTRVRHARC